MSRFYASSGAVSLCAALLFGSQSLPLRAAADPADLEVAKRVERVFTSVAEEAFPAVVVITAQRDVEVELPGDSAQDLFEEFWRRYFREMPDQRGPQMPRRFPQDNLGSGFFISDDGFILTNSHVVDRADEIEVQLKDGRKFKAEVIGQDAPSDVALLRIDLDGGKVPFLRLGSSEKVKVGEYALAVGAPLYFQYTLTRGAISAKGRILPLPGMRVQYTEQEYIQIDALINPGNSGGPLLNIEGEVIGITTLISGQYSYYGFAVPIDIAKRVAESLRASGRVVRPWLGIRMSELDQDKRQYFGIDGGVFVEEADRSGPAHEAGIRNGDVILTIDGEKMLDPQQLKRAILSRKPGDEVKLEVLRRDRKETFELKLTEVPESLTQAGGRGEEAPAKSDDMASEIGLQVQPLASDSPVREQIEIPDDETGLLVTSVEPTSPAGRAGMDVYDVIIEVNYRKVESREDLNKALAEADSDRGALFYIFSGGSHRSVLVKDFKE